jgi:hypothetical protein
MLDWKPLLNPEYFMNETFLRMERKSANWMYGGIVMLKAWSALAGAVQQIKND